jgi:hypothetical protein
MNVQMAFFLVGLSATSLAPAWAWALPNKLQEYCRCTCGGSDVLVTPAGGVSVPNCFQMDLKTCSVDQGKTWSTLKCKGDTVAAISQRGSVGRNLTSRGRVLATPVPTHPPAAQ